MINDIIESLKEQEQRFKILFGIFIMVWSTVAFKLWLGEKNFWYVTDITERPDKPLFLNNYFWLIFIGACLISLVLLSIDRLISPDSFIIFKFLKATSRILGFIVLILPGLSLLYLGLFFFLIVFKLILSIIIIAAASYYSARAGDGLLSWLGSEKSND